MITSPSPASGLPAHTRAFYRDAMRLLAEWDIPFLVGGAYALAERTGIVRHTKDFDVFLMPDDARRALARFREAGYRGEMIFEHWLGKVYHGDDFVDLIFSSGNGACPVDAAWFEHSAEGQVLDTPALLCPVEEAVWQKAYICERERFDGADINHLLLAVGPSLDWDRLLARFGDHWRVLLAHLVLFGFAYPGEADAVPAWVTDELTRRLREEPPAEERICRGTLLSRTQYVRDVADEGYADGRLEVEGGMTAEQAEAWTEAGLNNWHG